MYALHQGQRRRFGYLIFPPSNAIENPSVGYAIGPFYEQLGTLSPVSTDQFVRDVFETQKDFRRCCSIIQL